MGCLSRYPKNKFNFIRWKEGNDVNTTDLGAAIDTCSADPVLVIPNNYRADDRKYIPSLVKGVTINHYVNLDSPSSESDFALWVIRLVKADGTLVDPVSLVLTKYIIDGTDFRFSVTGSIDSGVDVGLYRLEIHNSSTSKVKFLSNEISVLAEQGNLVKVEFRNSTTLWAFDYDIWPTLRNTIWLDLNLVDVDPQLEVSQYKAQSTGLVRNQKSYSSQIVKIESFLFDDGGHDGMKAFSQHDNVLINSKEYLPQTGYKIKTLPRSNRQKGELEMFDQEYSSFNLNG